jgi:hypothetical protein
VNRPALLKLIGVIIAIYGVYRVLLVPALFVGPAPPVLIACLLVETVAAFAAAVGLFVRAGWAPIATIVLGAAIAATQLVEAAIFGIIALDRAILVGAAAVLVAIAIASIAAHRPRGIVSA